VVGFSEELIRVISYEIQQKRTGVFINNTIENIKEVAGMIQFGSQCRVEVTAKWKVETGRVIAFMNGELMF
jgi:hypothetical protein